MSSTVSRAALPSVTTSQPIPVPIAGDGMVHAVTFNKPGAKLTYQNKWVRTRAFERDAQQNFSFSIMGEAANFDQTHSMAWIPHASADMGRANTALVWHEASKRLLALFEQARIGSAFAVSALTRCTIELDWLLIV